MSSGRLRMANWPLQRWIYVMVGAILLIWSVVDHTWLGIVLSGWFLIMGLAGFGCASGNCCKRS